MRRLIKWIGGTVGGIAAYRFVRRQEASLQATEEIVVDEPDARADELRAKIAESRAAEPATEEAAAAEPVPEPEEPESPEDRRRRVHEEGRASLDEMRSD